VGEFGGVLRLLLDRIEGSLTTFVAVVAVSGRGTGRALRLRGPHTAGKHGHEHDGHRALDGEELHGASNGCCSTRPATTMPPTSTRAHAALSRHEKLGTGWSSHGAAVTSRRPSHN